MSVILGLNAFHAGASAAILIDGIPVVAIAEERLNRKKYYAKFPSLAIKACLDVAGISIYDVDHIAIGRDSSSNRAKKNKVYIEQLIKVIEFSKNRTVERTLNGHKNPFIY